MASSRSWFALALAAVVGGLVFGLAMAGLTGVESATAQQPSASGGRFHVTSFGEQAILWDSQSGDTWQLAKSASPASPYVWLSLGRVTNAEEWQANEKVLTTRAADHQRRERERTKLQGQLGEIERLIQDRRKLSADSDKFNHYEKQAEQLRAQLKELEN